MTRLDLCEHTYSPSVLTGRIGCGESPENFIERLKPTQQVPCPWGSLEKIPCGKVEEMMFKSRECRDGKWDFPLALELGCGIGLNGSTVSGPKAGAAGITLFSDYVPVDTNSPENYVQIDITNPDQIYLGGLHCHWISATFVITGDIGNGNPCYGITWSSKEAMFASLNAIMELLLPNGLLYISPTDGRIYEFARIYGFHVFPLPHGVLLQQRG